MTIGRLRIIAGEWGGRKLIAPRGLKIRPSTGKLREGMLSALQSRVSLHGLRVLDLFAGSGALGLEALSRGAGYAAFVEAHNLALKALKANIATLNLIPAQHAVIQAEVNRWLERAAPSAPSSNPTSLTQHPAFDVVFVDAPYAHHLTTTLALLCEHHWLAPQAWVCVENAANTPLTLPAMLEIVRQKRYGKAVSSLLRTTMPSP